MGKFAHFLSQVHPRASRKQRRLPNPARHGDTGLVRHNDHEPRIIRCGQNDRQFGYLCVSHSTSIQVDGQARGRAHTLPRAASVCLRLLVDRCDQRIQRIDFRAQGFQQREHHLACAFVHSHPTFNQTKDTAVPTSHCDDDDTARST